MVCSASLRTSVERTSGTWPEVFFTRVYLTHVPCSLGLDPLQLLFFSAFRLPIESTKVMGLKKWALSSVLTNWATSVSGIDSHASWFSNESYPFTDLETASLATGITPKSSSISRRVSSKSGLIPFALRLSLCDRFQSGPDFSDAVPTWVILDGLVPFFLPSLVSSSCRGLV